MLFHEIMTVEIDPDTEVKLLDGYRAIYDVPKRLRHPNFGRAQS